MEDFAVGGREHAQTPEGARGRWLGILRGVACLERGPARSGAGSRDVNSLSSRRESLKIAERIGGLKRDRIRNPGGKVPRDTWDRVEELERPAGGGGPRDSRPFGLRSGASRRQIRGYLRPSRPETHERFPQSAAPRSGPLGAWPDGGSHQNSPGACACQAETPFLNQQLDRDPKRTR